MYAYGVGWMMPMCGKNRRLPELFYQISLNPVNLLYAIDYHKRNAVYEADIYEIHPQKLPASIA